MALPTRPKPPSREDILARRRAAEEEALLREVDDAVRQDEMAEFGRRFGLPLAIVFILLLAAFGGYLYWQHHQNAEREQNSEQIVTALDQVQANNMKQADAKLAPVIKDGSPAARSTARMLSAAIAVENSDPDQAVKTLAEIAADPKAPQPMRDLALVRKVTLQFDKMDKSKVISTLSQLAVPGNPYFGSAGELTAMAYLEQGKKQEAGTMFAAIAKDKTVSESIRSRSRQMAGVLGVDAIVDPQKLLAQQSGASAGAPEEGAPPPGAE